MNVHYLKMARCQTGSATRSEAAITGCIGSFTPNMQAMLHVFLKMLAIGSTTQKEKDDADRCEGARAAKTGNEMALSPTFL